MEGAPKNVWVSWWYEYLTHPCPFTDPRSSGEMIYLIENWWKNNPKKLKEQRLMLALRVHRNPEHWLTGEVTAADGLLIPKPVMSCHDTIMSCYVGSYVVLKKCASRSTAVNLTPCPSLPQEDRALIHVWARTAVTSPVSPATSPRWKVKPHLEILLIY